MLDHIFVHPHVFAWLVTARRVQAQVHEYPLSRCDAPGESWYIQQGTERFVRSGSDGDPESSTHDRVQKECSESYCSSAGLVMELENTVRILATY